MQNNNLKVMIDPTHGGIDFGISYEGVYEKDLVLELSKYIQERLKTLGIETKLTRNTDKTLSFDDRIKIIKDTYGDKENVLVISNGLNPIYEDGANIIYPNRQINLKLVNDLKSELEKSGIKPVNTYSRTNIEGILDASILQKAFNNATILIINYGNILKNTKDGKIPLELYNYGEAIVKAIADNQNIPYVPPTNYNMQTHLVRQGESLYSIANNYNVTVNELKRLNKLSSNKLSIGQLLKIPNNNFRNNNIYTVLSGDTLYSIAKKNNTTITELMKLNNLSSNLISINQELYIK